MFSYRLSIVHFWSLIFLYIWAGPHHLLYTALPDWAQSLGTVFSVMLIAPSWGGMVNGLLTLRGAWDRVRESAVLKFMVVGVTAYGMSTFEGPMMSLKNVNALTHYTDYVIGHVHLGALAWNGGLSFAMLYYIIPRIYGTKLYSERLANVHFWLATLGILFYAIPMYVSGITQSLMWQQFTPDGVLQYPNFLETVVRLRPMYALRAGGGSSTCSAGLSPSTTCIEPHGKARSSRRNRRKRRRWCDSERQRTDHHGTAHWSRGRCSSRCGPWLPCS